MTLRDFAGIGAGPRRLALRTGRGVRVLDLTEVSWVSAEGDYVRFHESSRTLLVRKTMAAAERELATRRFARIHRSAIVNLDHVVEFRAAAGGDGRVLLRNGVVLPMSRVYRRRAVQ